MFSPLDILLGAAGVVVALAIAAPFLTLRRRHMRPARPAPVATPAPVAVELQRQTVS
jgi:hypothetical protein